MMASYKPYPGPEFSRRSIYTLPFVTDFDFGSFYRWARETRETHAVAFSNLNTIACMIRDSAFKKGMRKFDFVLPDGSSIQLLFRLFGLGRIKRFAGETVMSKMVRQDRELVHFFVGSTDEVLGKICVRAKKENPSIKIGGTYSPPYEKQFSEETNAQILEAIHSAKPDVVWVGFGCPKQEAWIAENKLSMPGVRLILGVGAAFDFYSGQVKRAPSFFQKYGIEFLYRLVMQPRKTWPRVFRDPLLVLAHFEELREPQGVNR